MIARPLALASRRRFLQTAGLAAMAASVRSGNLFAQVPPTDIVAANRAAAAKAKIVVTPLRRNVSAVTGSGGNIAVLTGTDGKLLVDSGYSTSRPNIEAALLTLDANPMKHLIDTHWHFDHTDGNEWMHGAGATIVAQDNTLKRMSVATTIEAFHYTFPAALTGALPTVTFADEKTLSTNGSTLHLRHYNPAHTDTDLYVHFTEADVLHTGDTWFNGAYPFIDYSTGGSIDGMIAAAKRNLSLATGTTIIIPGHGPIGNKEQLQACHDMLAEVRASVAKLKAKGMTLDDVLAAKPSAAYDAKWGAGSRSPASFLGLVYQGV